MGSPLGCIFANFYMSKLENDIIPNLQPPPKLYARYIDDIIMVVENEAQLLDIKQKFIESSVLKFTHEIGNNKLAFLDVLIENDNNNIRTSVYTKATSAGQLLNFKSECPLKYKKSVIKSMLHRGFKISSDMELFNAEVHRLRQTFSNNNYPMKIIDSCIKEFFDSKNKTANNHQQKNKIKIYYENQMHDNHLKDEKAIKDIISQNVKPTNPNDELDVVIYYKNLKTRNLLMKNNIASNPDKLSLSWTVYKYSCTREDCELPNPSYIGQTRNTIKKRLDQHRKDGAIKEHLHTKHKTDITQLELENNTIPIKQFTDTRRLFIYEALIILKERPDINRQKDNFIHPLKLFSRSTGHISNNTTHTSITNSQHTYNLRSSQTQNT